MVTISLTPREKIRKAIVKVGMERPFFGHLVFHLNPIEEERIPTLAINRRADMYYNPKLVENLTLEQTKTVVVHEILHPGLSHFGRKGSRNATIWNYANDLSINDTLISEGFEFPTWGDVIPEEVHNEFPEAMAKIEDKDIGLVPNYNHSYTFENWGFTIENIHKKSSEELYAEIEENIPEDEKVPQPQNSSVSKKPPENGNENGNGQDDGQQGGGQGQDSDQKEDENGNGSGSSGNKEDEGNKSGGGSGQEDNEEDESQDGEGQDTELKDDHNGPMTIDHHDDRSPKQMGQDKRDVEKKKNEIKQARAKAMANAKQQGHTPVGMDRKIDDIQKSKINWKSVLHGFVSRSIPEKYDWNRPNKRYRSQGIYLPSYKSEKVELVLSVDTSGSISDEELQEFISEVYGIVEGFSQVDLTVIQHDAKVQAVNNIRQRRDVEDIELKGGGGTDHRPVFDYIKENENQSRVYVGFTDGWTTVPDKRELPSGLNVIWVVDNFEVDEERLPYGRILRKPLNE